MPKKEIKKTEVKKIVSLKDMTLAELTTKSRELYAEICKIKLEKSVGRLKNVRSIFSKRKELARIKTIIGVKS